MRSFRFIALLYKAVARGFPDAPHDGSFVFLRVKDDARYDLLYENCPTNRNLPFARLGFLIPFFLIILRTFRFSKK